MSAKIIKVIVGSNNPVKINATKNAISSIFPNTEVLCEGIHAPSGVADQPMSAAETRNGAINRAQYCKKQFINDIKKPDFYIALEGGIDLTLDGPMTFAYFAILNEQQQSIGRSASLPIPDYIYQALKKGQELGDVMDTVFNTHNVKQKGGAIGLLTHGAATRESIYTQALILALAPFLNEKLFTQ
ncbi:inosine/xanthosine triphosphatase [Pseudoalteromonas denitrificans]|jgi:inosine/xanthosine triphosphatase|uniref:Inosine/xanthosine triphosphatase n=1 Tax=Pseudoalteromonas denitrificans DSM 6059 TaxID=1123010 RepID=A0A1I1PRP1_9GAMM|nr:inosine/xanthosine triphosphatase [Pseudoalteromonas denitrificans]SFD12357.1 inosine/xanthosine triphosphatase [Pseudoalteromonas denitrificans DSM 6059]